MRVLNSYESTIKKGDTMTYPEACGILGIPYYADIDTIKKAYRSLCKQYHPDENQNPQAVIYYERVQVAYQVIQQYMESVRLQNTEYAEAPRMQAKTGIRQPKVFGSSAEAKQWVKNRAHNEKVHRKMERQNVKRKLEQQKAEEQQKQKEEAEGDLEMHRMSANRVADIIQDIIREEQHERFAEQQAKKAFAARQRQIEEEQKRWNRW